jgi:HAD superfamily hydrolase (TIGR01459 family)
MTARKPAGLSAIADAFDAVLLDQFGVLHDGERPYPEAASCLGQLHRAGKRMVVLSNSGRRAAHNSARLGELGLPVALLDGVVTSGEACWRALRDRADAFHAGLGRHCLLLAEPQDRGFLDELDYTMVDRPGQADFLLAVTVGSQRSVDEREPQLRAGARLRLPLLCANNDLVRPAGGRALLPAPGALARRYAELGGSVHGYGKPLRSIFDDSLAMLDGTPRSRVLMVGDSIEHDIAGARDAGIGSVYIRGGIAAGDARTTDAKAAAADAQPTYVMERLRW